MSEDVLPTVCPFCASRDVSIPAERPIRIQIGPGYDIEIGQRHALAQYGPVMTEAVTALVRRVAADFESGSVSSEDILKRHNKGIFQCGAFVASCASCGKDFNFTRQLDLWVGLHYQDAIWVLSRKWTDAALRDTFGIGLQDVRTLTGHIDPAESIAKSLANADPQKYGRLTQAVQLADELPKGKGGGAFEEILAVILLSLLSSAIYDFAKMPAVSLFHSIRRSFGSWRTRRRLSSMLGAFPVKSLVEALSEKELKQLVGSRDFQKMSMARRKAFIQKAATASAKKLKKDLLAIARQQRRVAP